MADKTKKPKIVELNSKEQAVYAVLPLPEEETGDLIFMKLSDIAGDAFTKKGTSAGTKGNSWVRNSLRKLVRLGLVKHKTGKSGSYARTALTLAEVLKKAVGS